MLPILQLLLLLRAFQLDIAVIVESCDSEGCDADFADIDAELVQQSVELLQHRTSSKKDDPDGNAPIEPPKESDIPNDVIERMVHFQSSPPAELQPRRIYSGVPLKRSGGCSTVSSCAEFRCSNDEWNCYKAVYYALSEGFWKYPEAFPNLTYKSTFEDFQESIRLSKPELNCPQACPARSPTITVDPGCPPPTARPEPDPTNPFALNGVSWPEMCFSGDDEEHVFIIGDWGAIERQKRWGSGTTPAQIGKRPVVAGIDDQAQQLVANQFNAHGAQKNPRFVLNGGDNFYWGGVGSPSVGEMCGKPMEKIHLSWQNPNAGNNRMFHNVFDNMYKGPGIDGKPWLSVLGNHDWGGIFFNAAVDQQIYYTWGNSRWVMPGLYFHQHVTYPTKNMSMDIYMLDTNNQDTREPDFDPGHNICGNRNSPTATCPQGPPNLASCASWFSNLWQTQLAWLDQKLSQSTADWQIVVTHFPPDPKGWTMYPGHVDDWRRVGKKHGIDLVVGSHRHDQEMWNKNSWNVRNGGQIPYVVVGGGGGVTSETDPSLNREQYGFIDMTVTKDKLKLDLINQNGVLTRTMEVEKTLPE